MKILLGNFLEVQWLGLGAFTARAGVQSLVWELRSHKPHGAAKKKKILLNILLSFLETTTMPRVLTRSTMLQTPRPHLGSGELRQEECVFVFFF